MEVEFIPGEMSLVKKLILPEGTELRKVTKKNRYMVAVYEIQDGKMVMVYSKKEYERKFTDDELVSIEKATGRAEVATFFLSDTRASPGARFHRFYSDKISQLFSNIHFSGYNITGDNVFVGAYTIWVTEEDDCKKVAEEFKFIYKLKKKLFPDMPHRAISIMEDNDDDDDDLSFYLDIDESNKWSLKSSSDYSEKKTLETFKTLLEAVKYIQKNLPRGW